MLIKLNYMEQLKKRILKNRIIKNNNIIKKDKKLIKNNKMN
jgi:hypothetical protein